MVTEVSPVGTEVHNASKGTSLSSGGVPQGRLHFLLLCTLIFSMLLCTNQEYSLVAAEQKTCCTTVCPGSLMYVLLFAEAMVADRQPGLAPAAVGWHRLQGQALPGWLPVCKPASPHQGPPKQADHLCRAGSTGCRHCSPVGGCTEQPHPGGPRISPLPGHHISTLLICTYIKHIGCPCNHCSMRILASVSIKQFTSVCSELQRHPGPGQKQPPSAIICCINVTADVHT